jgi:hypothetical protein
MIVPHFLMRGLGSTGGASGIYDGPEECYIINRWNHRSRAGPTFSGV